MEQLRAQNAEAPAGLEQPERVDDTSLILAQGSPPIGATTVYNAADSYVDVAPDSPFILLASPSAQVDDAPCSPVIPLA